MQAKAHKKESKNKQAKLFNVVASLTGGSGKMAPKVGASWTIPDKLRSR